MKNENLLKISDLKVSFLDPQGSSKEIQALKGINLSVLRGSFTSIVGESGSGKSVTSLSITGLVKAKSTTGRILWCSDESAVDLLLLGEKERLRFRGKEISYVFQDPAASLNPVLRVGPQIAEAYQAHFNVDKTIAKARALECFASVQLKDSERVFKSYPHELSGGMRQRAMIAMALITEPKLLIADEPTTALDSTVETEILKLLIKIKEERKLSILFITHDIAHAFSYSDRIYVMRDGRVEEALERAEGKFIPKTDYTKKLFAASFWEVAPKSILVV